MHIENETLEVVIYRVQGKYTEKLEDIENNN